MAAEQAGKALTLEAPLVLAAEEEEQVVQGLLVLMLQRRHLTQAVMEETQQYKVHRGQVELMVIRWEVEAARVVEPVTHQQVMEMAVAPNMVVEAEAGQAVPPIRHMPMTNNRAVPVFTVQAEEEAAEPQLLGLVKI